MSELFREVLNASFSGGVVILAVLVLRLVLKKAPKKYICLLWILAGVRLLVPFSVESELSLQPREQAVTELEWQDLRDYGQIVQEIETGETTAISAERVTTAEHSEPLDTDVNVIVKTEINWAMLAPYLWLAGAAGLSGCSVISYLRLKRRVQEAVILEQGVWECDRIDTAFILGFVRPRIYIPMGISRENRWFILEHERIHLRRGDHWFKLIGFAALAVHWFNPLVWAGYILLCKDIEMACDERVVRGMPLEERKAYSAALLACSTNRRVTAACPVAFGEVSVKERIKSVLNYRKPRFWISILAVAAVVFVAVCFGTSPAEEEQDWSFLNYENAVPLAAGQDVLTAVHYAAEGETDHIGIGMVEGKTLAEYLDSAEWSEKWFEPSDTSSPGSVAFNIAEGLRINIYDRRFASVEFGGEVRYYRTGWNDYEAAVEMLLPADEERIEASARREFDIYLGTATIETGWGITLRAADVTDVGMTLYLERSGGTYPGYLETGQYYWLERWNGSKWETVEEIGEAYFTTEALWFPPEGSQRWSLNWESRYGALPAGSYRVGKTISTGTTYQVGVDLKHEAQKEVTWNYYAEFELSGTVGQTLEAFFRNDCPARMTPEEILLLDYDEQFALVFYSGEGPVLKFCRYVQEGEEIRITGVCEGGYTLSGGLSINCLELDGNYIYFGTVSDSHFDPGDDTVTELEWSKLCLTDAGGATTELDMTGCQGYFCILEEPLADFQAIDTNHVVCLDYARYTQQGYAIDAVDTWQTE